MAFDGSEWLGIDEDAYDDAAPADAALTQRLNSNARWIEGSFDRCSLATLLDGGAPLTADVPLGRPLASIQETTWLYVPLDFDRRPTTLQVLIGCQAQTQGTTSDPSIEIWAYLEGEEFTVARQAVINEDDTYDSVLEITFDDIPATRPQSAVLRLAVRSLTSETIGGGSTQADAYSRTLFYKDGGGGGGGAPYDDESPGTDQPTTDSLDVQTTSRIFGQNDDGADHAISMQNSSKFGGLGNKGMELAGYDAYQLFELAGFVSASRVYRSHTSYLMVRNVSLRISYLDDYFRQSELRSNIQELSDVNRRHVAVNTRQWERPRLLSIGEEGRRLPSASPSLWPANYRSLWTHADRDNAETEIVRIACAPDSSMSSIQVNVVNAGVHMMDPPAPDRGFLPESALSNLMRARTTAQWEMVARIEQWKTGTTPDVVGENSQFVSVDHFPVVLSPFFPLLQSAYFQRFWTTTSDYRFTYREGQLYEHDLRILGIIALTVSPGNDFDPDLPYDVVVAAKPTGDDPIYRWSRAATAGSKGPPDQYFANQYLRILKLGHSAYLRR